MGTTWEHAQLEIQKFLKIRITLLRISVSAATIFVDHLITCDNKDQLL